MAVTISWQSFKGGKPPYSQVEDFSQAGSIGRAPNNQFVLHDPEKYVSRYHAELTFEDNNWFIQDISSTATVINNSVTLKKGQTFLLSAGDQIAIGESVLVVDAITQSYDDGNALVAHEPLKETKQSSFDDVKSLEQDATVTDATEEDLTPNVQVAPATNEAPQTITPKPPKVEIVSFEIKPVAKPDSSDEKQGVAINMPTPGQTDALKSSASVGINSNSTSDEPSTASGSRTEKSQVAFSVDIPKSIERSEEGGAPETPEPVLVPSELDNLSTSFDRREQNSASIESEIHQSLSTQSATPEASATQSPRSEDSLPEGPSQEKVSNENTAESLIFNIDDFFNDDPEPVASETPTIQDSPLPQPQASTQSDSTSIPQQGVNTQIATPVASAPKQTSHEVSQDTLALRAFLKELDLDPSQLIGQQKTDIMRAAGTVLKTLTEGMMGVLNARSAMKEKLAMDQTQIRQAKNNPFKFSGSPEEALAKMLTQEAGYLDPVSAAREAVDDAKAHQMAMISGLNIAIQQTIESFDPKSLEDEFEVGFALSKKAKYWDIYCSIYESIADSAQSDSTNIFIKHFKEHYELQLNKLKHN
ncbi:type VI secretion system-associated FHA domain protein TagH [Ningiella sp. W23]|uniref:type VI secretion system-associated FHA domain protein TagH n=1 Tax=Ningiella sp. W23 TaxID=3023715 RepID=UPI003757550C